MNVDLKRKSPYGTASLTLGIISIVFGLTWLISIPCGILAIILGNKGKKMVNSALGVAGKVTGIIGIVIGGLEVAFMLFIFLMYLISVAF